MQQNERWWCRETVTSFLKDWWVKVLPISVLACSPALVKNCGSVGNDFIREQVRILPLAIAMILGYQIPERAHCFRLFPAT